MRADGGERVPWKKQDWFYDDGCVPWRRRKELNMKNPAAPAVKREAEEDWGR